VNNQELMLRNHCNLVRRESNRLIQYLTRPRILKEEFQRRFLHTIHYKERRGRSQYLVRQVALRSSKKKEGMSNDERGGSKKEKLTNLGKKSLIQYQHASHS